MTSPYLPSRSGWQPDERFSAGAHSTHLPSSRPGSAGVRPDLATTGYPAWGSHAKRTSGSSETKLPGIQSILNDTSRPPNVEQNFWPRSTNQQIEASYRHGSHLQPQSPSRSPTNTSPRTGHIASDSTFDSSVQYFHGRREEIPPPSRHGLKRSYETSDLTHWGDVRDAGRPSAFPVHRTEAATLQAATSPSAPHYVTTENIPGQGTSYVYSDGSTCKPVVNGRTVKRELGVTKLGNPRKRQAEACIPCRTKKIKCERDGSARVCAHCQKQRLNCRWARSSGQTPDPEGDSVESAESLDGGTTSGSIYGSGPSVSPRHSPSLSASTLSNTKDDELIDNYMEERLRTTTDLTMQYPDNQGFWTYQRASAVSRSRTGNPIRDFGPSVDPFAANPEIALQLLGLYFAYRDDHTATIFPCRSFINWCVECKTKEQPDRMVLYAVLALGSVFSTNMELKRVSQELAGYAKELEQREFSKFSLQLAQARLHLTLYHWAKGFANHSFEYTNTGCRVLSALGYNTEEGCAAHVSPRPVDNEYGLTKAELIECRRRTFWLGYMTEHYNGYCSGHLGIFSDKDIWVCLPNDEADYHAGVDRSGPLFNNGRVDTSDCGSFTRLIALGAIWGDVTAEIYRAIHRPTTGYLDQYMAFYEETAERLLSWERTLPAHLRYSAENTNRNLRDKTFVTYYVIHALHLITAMRLNRYGLHRELPADIVRRNIRRARYYALLLLELVSAVAKSELFPLNKRPQYLENAICQPFPGYAVLGACDIISSRGTTCALHRAQRLVGDARTVVSECARFSNSAKQQKKMIDSRLNELCATAAMEYMGRDRWTFSQPVEKSFIPKQFDMIYFADTNIYFETLEDEDAQMRLSVEL